MSDTTALGSSVERPPHWARWPALAVPLGVALLALVIWQGEMRRPADPFEVRRWEAPTAPAPDPHPDVMEVVLWNIHSGEGRDDRTDLERVGRWIGRPDIAGLHEVRAPWLGKNQAARLGDITGTRSLFVPTESKWGHEGFGNALLSRQPPESMHLIPLPHTEGGYRTVLLLEFPWDDGSTLSVVLAHLSPEEDRPHQLAAVLDIFTRLAPPVILMGDLNTVADDPLITPVLERGDVVNPFPATAGDGRPRIDWILSRGLGVVDSDILDNDASDHPVLRVRYRLPEGATHVRDGPSKDKRGA